MDDFKRDLRANEKVLYTNPDQQLARALVSSLEAGANDQPLCILFDTCEVLSLDLEEWLRDSIVCPASETNLPLIFIVSGRYDQYRERQAVQADGSNRYTKGYADRLIDPAPVRWDMSRFADPEISDYLVQHRFDSKQELVDFVQSLSKGIPYAVQLVVCHT